MESPFEINENSEKRYYQGKLNFIIRLYYYFQEGVNQISALRTIGYGLIGLAGVMALNKSDASYWPIILIGLALIPVLTFVGWLWIYRGRKSTEYFTIKYTSVYSKYGVQMQEKQMQLLEEINEGIKKLNNKLDNK